jgi:hypothetical protein
MKQYYRLHACYNHYKFPLLYYLMRYYVPWPRQEDTPCSHRHQPARDRYSASLGSGGTRPSALTKSILEAVGVERPLERLGPLLERPRSPFCGPGALWESAEAAVMAKMTR